MSSPQQRPASITDVARLADVSVPTVSRVLTGAARVSAEKSARVQSAITKLGYRPNGAARALVRGNQNIIVVLTGNTTFYGYASTIQGIEEAARAAGTMVVIAVIESSTDEHVQDAIRLALSQPIAGIIVLNFDSAGVAAREQVPRDVPLALASGLPDSSRPQSVIDEFGGGRVITEYLLGLGHRTVHHVAIPRSMDAEDRRTSGWRAALSAAGATAPPVIAADWDARSGIAIGRDLAGRDDVTAVFCGNDEIAMGVIKGLMDSGKRVPEDVSVAGFDDHPIAELWSPAITTVKQDFVEMGRHTYALLAAAVRGEQVSNEPQPTQLVVRDSTAAPRA